MVIETNKIKVLVFKSNIANKHCIQLLQPTMDNHPGIIRWNVDYYDVDNVLRIETTSLKPLEVEKLVFTAGFYCEELPD
jgi:hypothetical protein